MDLVLKFVIEAACLTTVVLLAAVSTPFFGGRAWGWAMWLRSIGLLVVGIVYLVVNPSAATDLFPIVIGGSAFVISLVAFLLAIVLAWRFAHRGQRTKFDRQVAVNFGYMVVFGVFAAACLFVAVAISAAIVEGLATESAYQHAPNCATAPSDSCRSKTKASVVRTWADSSKGPHWIELVVAGGHQTVQIETSYDVWDTLAYEPTVDVTSWRGHVTEVSVPGGGTMQTADSPHFALFLLVLGLVMSVFVFFLFAGYGIVYWVKWRAALGGVDTSQIAA